MIRYFENVRYDKGIKMAEITVIPNSVFRWYIDEISELNSCKEELNKAIDAKIKTLLEEGKENFSVHKFY